MTFKEFRDYVQTHFLTEEEPGCKVGMKQVTKNNGRRFWGLFIQKEEAGCEPCLYMERFYAKYLEGCPLEEILQEIRSVYSQTREYLESQRILPDFKDPDLDNLIFTLVNYELNKERLREVFHIRFMDLAMAFRLAVDGKEGEFGSMLLPTIWVKEWGIEAEKLVETAMKNTMDKYPVMVRSLESMVPWIRKAEQKREPQDDNEIPEEEPRMYVISNDQLTYGAAAILYDGVLEQMAEQTGSDLVILPSSVHEVIVLAEEADDEAIESYRRMVSDINHSIVEPGEILSFSIYYYDHINGRLYRR